MQVVRLRCLSVLLICLIGCKSEAASRSASTDRLENLPAGTQVVTFHSGELVLRGLLLRPKGQGSFPALLWNHGSAPGVANNAAFSAIGPVFVQHGWIFFMPYRRGQGLSASAGPYIVDEIRSAERRGGRSAGAKVALQLLETDHLDDQLAALRWLRERPYVQAKRIAVGGNSFGGIEAVLGAERGQYCAAIDAAGAAQMWAKAPELRERLKRAVRNSKVPIFFFQAENDFDTAPTSELAASMRAANKPFTKKIYGRFGGAAPGEGHALPFRGVEIWTDDALRFLGRACETPAAARPPGPAP